MTTRRTRILATLGPATHDPEVVGGLIEAGADAVRLNFSHGTSAGHAAACAAARAAAAGRGRALTVLQDLGGPKIRTGHLPEPVPVSRDDTWRLVLGTDVGGPGVIPCDFAPLFTSVSVGQHLLIDDGRIDTIVTAVDPGVLHLRVLEGGVVESRKGIHVPGSHVQTPALTDKDRRDLEAGAAIGVDMAALSFVQSPDDVREARDAAREAGLAGLPIIAKIERPLAVERIDAIVEASDGVMVARGDLGIELPLEAVPAVQRRVVLAARRRGVPVILATEVLESMRTAPRPTRAEVTDAAYAVEEGVDAIMLSGETAVGRHPVRAVATLATIIDHAERMRVDGGLRLPVDEVRATAHGLALCEAAVTLARRAGAAVIVAVTKAGQTPGLLAALRPGARIVAATANPVTAARLGLTWGVTVAVTEANDQASVRETMLARGLVAPGDVVVFVAMQASLGRGAGNFLSVERI